MSLLASPMDGQRLNGAWQRIAIRRIEDLSDAVLGAGVEAVQMSARPVIGALIHKFVDGMLFGSGWVEGNVALRGSLSSRDLTIGVGLGFGGPSRLWLREVATGVVGIFRAGDEHDAFYQDHALFLTVTLPEERLLVEAERQGLMIDARGLRRTGVHGRPMAAGTLAVLRQGALRAHGIHAGGSLGAGFEARVVEAFIDQLGRSPGIVGNWPTEPGQARIVARARDWIEANLDEPITIDAIAAAAGTSRRGLHRAFAAIVDEAPQAYVRRLRLHRIRRDLASDAEAARTIASVANQWGIGELGRLAGRYRALFGELPSETIVRARSHPAHLAQTA